MTEKSPAVKISSEDVHYDFILSSGPGGQNVNKVSTAVQLRFNARNSKSLKPAVRERLYKLAGRSVNSAGEVVIESKRFRSQQRNREDALSRLLRLIEKASVTPKIRRKSQPTEASKQKRLQSKKHRSEIKNLRKRASLED